MRAAPQKQAPVSPSPLGSGVLPRRPPTWSGRLQVRRCDSRRCLGFKPLSPSSSVGFGRRLCSPLPERSPAGIQPSGRSRVRSGYRGKRKPVLRRWSPRPASPCARLSQQPGSHVRALAGKQVGPASTHVPRDSAYTPGARRAPPRSLLSGRQLGLGV